MLYSVLFFDDVFELLGESPVLAIHEVDLTVALVSPCMLLVVMEMRCLYACMVQMVDALSNNGRILVHQCSGQSPPSLTHIIPDLFHRLLYTWKVR